MKFLDLKNPEDSKIWENVIELGHDANLHPCPYGQNFKESESCKYYEPCSDIFDQLGDDKGECTYALFLGFKTKCELLPITEEN
jgi:hypothetical protein